jgi:hypothetical protein
MSDSRSSFPPPTAGPFEPQPAPQPAPAPAPNVYSPTSPYATMPGGPGGPGAQLVASRPQAYWPLSVIATFFSFVFGGIALYFSWRVGDRWKVGDVEAARKASRMVVVWSVIGIVVGFFFLVWLLSGTSDPYYYEY